MTDDHRLLELQEIDSSIDRLEARKRDLEEGTALREARQAADEIEERLGELRLALDSVVREETRLESEADSLERKIADEEKRLYDGSVANPKELGAIQAEIANLRQRKVRVEDDVLEQMARREDMEARVPDLERELAQGRSDAETQETSSRDEAEGVAGEIDERRASRAALAGEIDEELLELYEDLRQKKHGVGAAALVDGVCGGCHQKLSALELDRIKRTEGIRRCEYCRRILVIG
jgi:hypothetical protein